MNRKIIVNIQFVLIYAGLLITGFLLFTPTHVNLIPIAFITCLIGLSLGNIIRGIDRINLKIKARRNQQLSDLRNLYQKSNYLEEQLREVRNQIAKYPADPSVFVFISNYIKNMQEEPEQVKGKGMSEILYNIITRLENLENLPHNKPATQESTPEENTHKNNRT